MSVSRRQFLNYAMLGLGNMAFPGLSYANQPATSIIRKTLLDNELNISIPEGSTIRQIAQSSRPVINRNEFIWHAAPDGGACFDTEDKGWIYVSNSEMAERQGGVGAIRFNSDGEIIDAYSILSNTNRNCAGGKTPWNTWLSCEEYGDQGQVYECDPYGKQNAIVRPLLGSFNHEAAAIDPDSGYVYLTEDVPDGCFYRFKPEEKNDLSKGILEVAIANRNTLQWKAIEDPNAIKTPTRFQILEAARFKGGEGIIYHNKQIFFTTKIDNIVWRYDIATRLINKIYDAADYDQPLLTGVDNIDVSPSGELLVAEDGGNMQIIALDKQYRPHVLVEVHGQDKSEITGPAFSPDGKHLYFSSQRGKTGKSEDGITYEITFS